MTGIKDLIAPAVSLCIALATSCDSSDGAGDGDEGGSGAAGRRRIDRAPAAPIDVPDGSLAAYNGALARVYVASDDVVERIELPVGAASEHFAIDGSILALAGR